MKGILIINRLIRDDKQKNIIRTGLKCFTNSDSRKDTIRKMKEIEDYSRLLKLLKNSKNPEEKTISKKTVFKIQADSIVNSKADLLSNSRLNKNLKNEANNEKKTMTKYNELLLRLKLKYYDLFLIFKTYTNVSRKIILEFIKEAYFKGVKNFSVLYFLLFFILLSLSFDNLPENLGKPSIINNCKYKTIYSNN